MQACSDSPVDVYILVKRLCQRTRRRNYCRRWDKDCSKRRCVSFCLPVHTCVCIYIVILTPTPTRSWQGAPTWPWTQTIGWRRRRGEWGGREHYSSKSTSRSWGPGWAHGWGTSATRRGTYLLSVTCLSTCLVCYVGTLVQVLLAICNCLSKLMYSSSCYSSTVV